MDFDFSYILARALPIPTPSDFKLAQKFKSMRNLPRTGHIINCYLPSQCSAYNRDGSRSETLSADGRLRQNLKHTLPPTP